MKTTTKAMDESYKGVTFMDCPLGNCYLEIWFAYISNWMQKHKSRDVSPAA